MVDRTLDVKGFNCPLPILPARESLTDMAPGATLEVLATDPGAVKDCEAFGRTAGTARVASTIAGRADRILIKRAG